MMNNRNQEGVAIITVLVVFFLASIIATAMTKRQQIDIHTTSKFIAASQAKLYAKSAALYTDILLRRDVLNSKKVDHYKEPWAHKKTSLLGIKNLGLDVEDLQGKFNLNSLAQPSIHRARFAILLEKLSLDAGLNDAIIDWVDTDDKVGTQGAEDLFYAQKNPSYRTANVPMADISELRLIRGMDEATYKTLLPHVTILPTRSNNINVNTASPILLSVYITDEGQLKNILLQRTLKGFISTIEFNIARLGARGLSLKSQYFKVKSRAMVAETVRHHTAIIIRKIEDDKTVITTIIEQHMMSDRVF